MEPVPESTEVPSNRYPGQPRMSQDMPRVNMGDRPKLDTRKHSLLKSPSLNFQNSLFLESPPHMPHVMSSEMRSHLGVPEVQHGGHNGQYRSSNQPKLPVDIRKNKKLSQIDYPVRVGGQSAKASSSDYPFDVGNLTRQTSRRSISRRPSSRMEDDQSLLDWPSLEGNSSSPKFSNPSHRDKIAYFGESWLDPRHTYS